MVCQGNCNKAACCALFKLLCDNPVDITFVKRSAGTLYADNLDFMPLNSLINSDSLLVLRVVYVISEPLQIMKQEASPEALAEGGEQSHNQNKKNADCI